MYNITIILNDSSFDFETKIEPQVGDVIFIGSHRYFKVSGRTLSIKSNDIVLKGELESNDK